jgi:hypothetical protein
MRWKDIGIRAAKTAGQTFLAVVIPMLTTDLIGNESALLKVAYAAGIAALAAALSVVQNALLQSLE